MIHRLRLWRLFRLVMAFFAGIVWRILRATWRVRVVGGPGAGARIFVCWHGDLAALSALPAAWFRDRGDPPGALAMLISQSEDGDLAARWARGLGLDVLRGSTHRGAVVAGLALLRRLRRGGRVALAGDGSRGPRRQLVARVARLARLGGAEISVVAAAASRVWRLRSWDHLVIPKPFSRVVIAWEAAIEVDEEVARALRVASGRAARVLVGGDDDRVDTEGVRAADARDAPREEAIDVASS